MIKQNNTNGVNKIIPDDVNKNNTNDKTKSY